MRADTVCSASKSMGYKLRLILAIEGLSEENKAVINTTVSFGVAKLDCFDAVESVISLKCNPKHCAALIAKHGIALGRLLS